MSSDTTPGVRERRPGVFEVRVYVGYDATRDRRITRSRTVRGSLSDALEAREALLTEVRKEASARSGPTLREHFDNVLSRLRGLRRSENTLVGYADHMDALINGLWHIARDHRGRWIVDEAHEGCSCEPTMSLEVRPIKRCPLCNQTFTAMRRNATYCSARCRSRSFQLRRTAGIHLGEAQLAGQTEVTVERKTCTCRFIRELVAPGIGNPPVAGVTADMIEQFYADLARAGLSAETISRYHATFRLAFNRARLAENPVVRADRPTRSSKVAQHRPEDHEVFDLLNAAFQEDRSLGVAIQLAHAAGPRRGEIAAARWSQIGHDSWLIDDAARSPRGSRPTVGNGTKGHAERDVHLDDETMAVLREHRRRMEARAAAAGTALTGDAFLLSDAPDGSVPWRPGKLTAAIARLRKQSAYRDRLQDLRGWSHAVAFEAARDLAEVTRRGGWSSPDVFFKYYLRTTRSRDTRAAEAIAARRRAAGRTSVRPLEIEEQLAPVPGADRRRGSSWTYVGSVAAVRDGRTRRPVRYRLVEVTSGALHIVHGEAPHLAQG